VNEVATVPDRQAWWMERLQVLERQPTLAGLSSAGTQRLERIGEWRMSIGGREGKIRKASSWKDC
jgi:hypothetical protein